MPGSHVIVKTNGKELPGAKLEIRDTDGNLVEGWTSTKTSHTVRGLELKKEYTLTEKRAPDGYAEAESIVFKLVQDDSEQSNMVYVKSNDDWTKHNDATVIMQDAPVLDIDKTDIAGNLLPGATLTIRDANDEVVDTWTTDYKTHRVPISDEFIKLSDGNKEYIYTLTEDAAPAGFEIANSVQFKLEPLMTGFLFRPRKCGCRMDTRRQAVNSDDRRSHAPRGHAHTDSGSHTAADARCDPGAHSCSHAGYYAAQSADPPADRRWFPAAGYCGRVSCVCDRYRTVDRQAEKCAERNF